MFASTALTKIGGVARTRELSALGVTRDSIRSAYRRGEICRVRKGVYATSAQSAATTAARHGGRLTCVSALVAAGVWILDKPTALHVDVGRKGRVFEHDLCECVVHHHDGQTRLGSASCADALITALQCLTHEAFFAAFESAWRHRLVSARDRAQIIAAAPKALAARLRQARPNADSGLESIFRYRLLALGIELESQVKLTGVGYIDFRHGFVLFEIDGKENHASASKRHDDLMRDAAALRLGYTTVRFDYAMIVHDWFGVAATVMAVINRSEVSPKRQALA